VIVTGGLGFIGSNLSLDLLKKGAEVQIIDSLLEGSGANFANVSPLLPQLSIRKDDVRNPKISEMMKEARIVFHLAAQTNRALALEQPRLDLEINYLGTINILEACRKSEVLETLVFTSSRAVIGEPENLPVNENCTTRPRDIYAIDKLAAEQACLLYKKLYGLPVVVVRPSNIYGPRGQLRNPNYGIINLFIGNVLRGRPVLVFGSGNQTRDPLFVDDLVEALVHLSVEQKAVGEIFMAGSGKEISVADLANLVVKIYGRGTVKHVDFPKSLLAADVQRFRVDFGKLSNWIEWHPRVELADGIRETIAYYENRLSDYA
jgi:UDP-glucose 4-epimerase